MNGYAHVEIHAVVNGIYHESLAEALVGDPTGFSRLLREIADEWDLAGIELSTLEAEEDGLFE